MGAFPQHLVTSRVHRDENAGQSLTRISSTPAVRFDALIRRAQQRHVEPVHWGSAP
jgi:hypothetical protein